jgi:hypothetical protein
MSGGGHGDSAELASAESDSPVLAWSAQNTAETGAL